MIVHRALRGLAGRQTWRLGPKGWSMRELAVSSSSSIDACLGSLMSRWYTPLDGLKIRAGLLSIIPTRKMAVLVERVSDPDGQHQGDVELDPFLPPPCLSSLEH